MKLLVICSILLILSGCSSSEFTSAPDCMIKKVDNTSYLTCNGETLELADGADGADGLFVDVLDPCGPQTSHDDVILVTRNGDHIAYFEVPNSTNDRLVILKEGVTYTTTDGTNCKFKIVNGVLID